MPQLCPSTDPRVRRTRRQLQDALDKLLREKALDAISVQDITSRAAVNRATFYDHFGDKFSLLECMVATRFHELLTERQVQYDGTCGSALNSMVLAVCDYLVDLRGSAGDGSRPLEPHMESAIINVLRGLFLEGIQRHCCSDATPPGMVAAAASWAIYGAVREWIQSGDRPPAESVAATVANLVAPMLKGLQPVEAT